MWRAVTQIMLAGLFRAIILVYTGYFYGVVKKCYRRRMAETEEQQSAAKFTRRFTMQYGGGPENSQRPSSELLLRTFVGKGLKVAPALQSVRYTVKGLMTSCQFSTFPGRIQ
ncbi:hypothetical protein Y032_0152g2862 [Ancylostoma ceylanicum]|uniref:Uncharacterized protein n=1 Tax=Ancylostoma ceylanicum TaxID=53326 RepID=A0A016T0U8_9BILA|nr:hypothetical protein Y032_0152g2862 [Ancylostoma ceylanicum]